MEKDKNSVLRGLIRGGLAQGVRAPNYLKKDALAVMADLLEEANRKNVKLLITYAMPDPKNCINQSAADLLVANDCVTHIFLFSGNQESDR